jgi:hypothetical protein
LLYAILAFGLGWGHVEAAAAAASHPPGVTYPLTPATYQPSGLAQPLPSTKRYVLIWKDQLIPDGYTEAEKNWVVTHFVGTQKLFQRQIDDYRTRNPNFLMLVYHLAYGLNGADQPNPVGNITGPNTFGQEDTDTFTPWVNSHGVTRENAYQHTSTPPTSSNRVSYPDPFWLMDIASSEWRSYLFSTLIAWQGWATSKATGTFLDVAFPPWYSYQPPQWWTIPAGGSSRDALSHWWRPRALDYFDAMRVAFTPNGTHPRYLVIPNPDALVDNTDEPDWLAGTDGVFTENWQAILANPGDWNLSCRRVVQYVTSQRKVWMVDITNEALNFTQAERELLIGTYLLLRNGTSYIMFGNGLAWYPEYEIDLGGYIGEPSVDIEALRQNGNGGSEGGLYVRTYARGLVLVNSSNFDLTYFLSSAMKQAQWSGGGFIDSAATPPDYSLTYTVDVPAGTVTVPARSVIVLRDPAGAPPPGDEGQSSADGGTPNDGGTPGGDGGSGGDGGQGGTGPDGGTDTRVSAVHASQGCGCGMTDPLASLWVLALAALPACRFGRKR